MKFNLYVPSSREKKEWEKYAKKDGRSLAQFIRLAIREKIDHMKYMEEMTENAELRQS